MSFNAQESGKPNRGTREHSGDLEPLRAASVGIPFRCLDHHSNGLLLGFVPEHRLAPNASGRDPAESQCLGFGQIEHVSVSVTEIVEGSEEVTPGAGSTLGYAAAALAAAEILGHDTQVLVRLVGVVRPEFARSKQMWVGGKTACESADCSR